MFGGKKSPEMEEGVPPPEEAEVVVEEGKVVVMKPGDYLVHIHVQSAKNICLEGADVSDPFVKIDLLGKSAQTVAKDDVSREAKITYDEHIFMEFKNQTKEQIEEANIMLSVANKGFFKADMIGQFEMAISKIYNMEDHVMLHQMIGLTNPDSKDFSKITGYITVSINVQGPGDEATQLEMGTEKEVTEKAPLMPSSVKKQYKQIYIRIFRAENLPIMDKAMLYGEGSIDAYLIMKYGSQCKLKTRVVTMKDKRVDWMEEMLIPIEMPIKDDTIRLQLWDKDITMDSLCCSLSLSVKSILKYKREDSMIKWINLYGAPTDRMGQNVDKMNNDPEAASQWKGRILVEYFAEDVKYPVRKKRDVQDQSVIDRVMAFMAPRDYQIMAELGSGICLPDSDDYQLKMVIGKREWKSKDPKVTAANFCRWDKRYAETFQDSYQSLKRFPYVYFYLMQGDEAICFKKVAIFEFMDPNMPLRWFEFTPDLAVGYVKLNYKAGFFSVRFYIRDVTAEGQIDPNSIPLWAQEPSGKPPAWKIRANIYQAESLPPADSNGTSDPYVEIWSPDEKSVRTQTCEDTNNPIFYDVKEIIYYFDDFESAPPIILNIFDTDEGVLADSEDFIGRAVIFLNEIEDLSRDDRIPYPTWHAVKLNFSDPYIEEGGGAILCSFQVVPASFEFAVPDPDEIYLDKMIELSPGVPLSMPDLQMSEFKCEIMVLGLRSLVSNGLLPIKKAYVKFNLKSLLPPEQAKAVENIQTQPNASGPDPSIRTTLQFEIKIPLDPTFCPRMTCDVFDQLFFGGAAQPHVGIFTLKLGDIIQEMRLKDKNMVNDLSYISKIMQQIIDYRSNGQSDKSVPQLVADYIIQAEKEKALAKKQQASVGDQILRELEASGIELPSSSALKGKSTQTDAQGKTVQDQTEMIKNKLGSNFRKKVEAAFKADLEAKKMELERIRLEAQRKMAGASKDSFANVVMPKYKYSERLKVDIEVNVPPVSLFKEIGHDPTPGAKQKHYRRYYPDELENITDEKGQKLIPTPFLSEKITRAQKPKKGGLLSFLKSDDNVPMHTLDVGSFKGIVKCWNQALYNKRKQEIDQTMKNVKQLIGKLFEIETGQKFTFDWNRIDPKKVTDFAQIEGALKELKRDYIRQAGIEQLQIYQHISNMLFDSQLATRLNSVTKCKVRLYMLEGFNFAQRDAFSASDPYLFIKCGKTEFNEQKNYQLDTPSPKFYKCYDFITDFPGAPVVEISAYDYDDFFGDELIGTSKLELDDRYFSRQWCAIERKPIEYRDLYHSSSTISQGVVKMWVEIDQKDSKIACLDPINIEPEPVKDFEMRLIIWKTKDIAMMDWEGTSDVYCRAFLDSNDDRSTDTHFRCSNGTASFNYRLLIPVKSQKPDYNVTIQAWDWDLIGGNELIGETQIDIGPLMDDILITNRTQALTYNYWSTYLQQIYAQSGSELANEIVFESTDDKEEMFWIPVRRYDKDEDKYVGTGEIQCSIRILPKSLAEKGKQGEGRNEPNNDPFCPPPEGRIELSLNPFTMLNQLLTPSMKMKLLLIITTGLCCYLCAMMMPMIISNIITKAVIG